MNLSINNTNGVSGAWNVGMNNAVAGNTASNAADRTKKSDWTVTNRLATAGDIEAAAITEEALTRDDDLGKLMKAAFDLPAPVIDFSKL